ncbi:MAG: histidine phosphatase family protein [Chitinophagaceae bacterium]|nr:histidine phosphatase family protein [Chitinophagaceae bacterium]
MKQLFIIRHAKSDQGFWGNDFERPLNDRGRSDALVMAKRLKDRQVNIDAWISSPAKRAKKTAEIFTETFKVVAGEIVFVSALYHASPEVFYDVISSLPDELNNIVVVSHNPGITYFVNSLVEDIKIDNMPTSGLFAIKTNISRWHEFNHSKKDFLFFDYPKRVVSNG